VIKNKGVTPVCLTVELVYTLGARARDLWGEWKCSRAHIESFLALYFLFVAFELSQAAVHVAVPVIPSPHDPYG
jgi:hypothetical protein